VLNKKAKYNIALNWIIIKLKNSKEKKFSSLNKELLNILGFKINSAISDKIKLRKLVLMNRGAVHYRW
jgi:hypothetical protein